MSRFTLFTFFFFACADAPMTPGVTGSVDDSTTPDVTNPNGGTNAGDDDDDDGVTAPVVLDSTWTVFERHFDLDECGMVDWLADQPLGDIEITGDLVEGFELLHARGLEICTMHEGEDTYRCDRRQDEDTSVEEDFGIDALLLLDIWATGFMVVDDTLEMTTEIITDCTGGGCWLAALQTGGFPCHSTVVVTAEPAS